MAERVNAELVKQQEYVPQETTSALGEAELLLFHRVPLVLNTLWEIAQGTAAQRANFKACQVLLDQAWKLAETLQERRNINPMTHAIEGAIDRLDEEKRLEILAKVEAALAGEVSTMNLQQLDDLQAKIIERRKELLKDLAADVAAMADADPQGR